MKKFISTLLVLSLSLSLAACSSNSSSTEAETSTEETTAEETTAEETSAETQAEDSGTVLSYDEYIAADVDTEVTVEAYVQAKQSWYADQATATVYAQDEDGAYFFYDMACSEEDYANLTEGTLIRVTGYKSEWEGEVEIIDASFEFVEGGDTFIAEPLDATELLGSDELIDHQNEKVSFTGLTVEASTDADGNDAAFLYNYDGSGSEGDDLYFNVSYNGETYSFVIESYLTDSSTDVYAAVEALEIGQTIDCEGFLYWYEGVNPHITSVTVTG